MSNSPSPNGLNGRDDHNAGIEACGLIVDENGHAMAWHKMARFGTDYGARPTPLLRHWSTTAAPLGHRPTPVADPGHRS